MNHFRSRFHLFGTYMHDGLQESVKSKHPQLLYEARLYRILSGGVGVPYVRWYGVESDYNVMVMDLLGNSLEDLFNICGRKFQLKTTLMIADQMVCSLSSFL